MDEAAPREDWGQHGSAMKALPNDAWRAFALALATGRPGHGKLARAARAAGFAKNSTPANLAKLAWKIAHDDRMVAAAAEVARKVVRVGAPEAAAALMDLVRNPKARDHCRALDMILSRSDPAVSQHSHEVLHRIEDPDTEALEELRALQQLGTAREKLLELFGPNGLDRLERRDAIDLARRADEAKIVDATVGAFDGAR